jgi:hypothetical protein
MGKRQKQSSVRIRPSKAISNDFFLVGCDHQSADIFPSTCLYQVCCIVPHVLLRKLPCSGFLAVSTVDIIPIKTIACPCEDSLALELAATSLASILLSVSDKSESEHLFLLEPLLQLILLID